MSLVEDLLENGEEIEIWTGELEPALMGRVSHVKLPLIRAVWGVKPFSDFLIIHSVAWRRRLSGKKRARAVVVTGFMYLPADFATVHFSHFEWFRQLKRAAKPLTFQVFLEILKSLPGCVTEVFLYYNPWRTHLLPVSEAVAADIKRWAAPWKPVSVVPNMARTDQFDPKMRPAWRTASRQELGISEEETILAFCSAGHFFRKGLSEAVLTVRLLRAEGRAVRLLVIGGQEKTLLRWRRLFEATHGDCTGAVIFTGMVTRSQYYLSCADAFFFPSRCEAFSLVEIEAATLGLPLFLTPHHGSEMILKNGVNGHLLPWDPPGMARVIGEKITAGLRPLEVPDTGRALSRDGYRLAWCQLLKDQPSRA